MKNTDKVTMTFGQLKKLIKETNENTPSKPSRERATDLLFRIEEEIDKEDYGYALRLLKEYENEINPFFPYDVQKLTKKCRYWLNDWGVNKEIFEIRDGVLVGYHGKDKKVDIPNSVKSIGQGVFEGHDEIETVYIPLGVEYVGDAAFRNCKKLKSVYFGFVNHGCLLKMITPYMLSGCVSLENIELPSPRLERIGYRAFKDCKNLKYIRIPKHVEVVGYEAFSGCDNLRLARVSNKTSLEDDVFPESTDVDIVDY